MMSLFKSFHFLHETKARNSSKTEDQGRDYKKPQGVVSGGGRGCGVTARGWPGPTSAQQSQMQQERSGEAAYRSSLMLLHLL